MHQSHVCLFLQGAVTKRPRLGFLSKDTKIHAAINAQALAKALHTVKGKVMCQMKKIN